MQNDVLSNCGSLLTKDTIGKKNHFKKHKMHFVTDSRFIIIVKMRRNHFKVIFRSINLKADRSVFVTKVLLKV